MPFLFPDVLLLEINDLILYLIGWRIQILNGVIYLRHAIDVKVVFLLRDHITYLFVLSAEGVHDRVTDAEDLAGNKRTIDRVIRPRLLLKHHIGSQYTTFSNMIQYIMIPVTIRQHDVYWARLYHIYLRARVAGIEQLLALLKKLLLRPVEKTAQYVLICITQELNIVLAQFDELFAL